MTEVIAVVSETVLTHEAPEEIIITDGVPETAVDDVLDKEIFNAVMCTRGSDVQGLQHVFKRGIVNANTPCFDGLSLLYLACTRKSYDVIKFLVSQGADINARIEEENLFTPLIFARRKRDMNMIRILMTPPDKLFVDVGVPKADDVIDTTNTEAISPDLTVDTISTPDPALDPGGVVCTICFEPVEKDLFFRIGSCGHYAFCRECVDGWFSAALKEAQIPRCPHKGCQAHASSADVRQCVTDSLLIDRYLQIEMGRFLIRMNDFRWCQACPDGGFVTPECRAAACVSCGVGFCATCFLPPHENQTCEEAYQDFMKTDIITHKIESERYLKKMTRPCPQCDAPIEKSGGCSHMTCRVCTYQFCWICRGPYKGMHTFGTVCPCK